MKRLAAVISLALIAIGSSRAALDPKSMSARLADLPGGFTVTSAKYVTNAQATQGLPTKLTAELAPSIKKWGRVTGYAVEFASTNGLAQSVGTSVDLYRHSSGARDAFAFTARYIKERPGGVEFTSASTGASLGQQSRAYFARFERNDSIHFVYMVMWRHREVVAFASVSAGSALLLKRQIVRRVAARMQARIASATGYSTE